MVWRCKGRAFEKRKGGHRIEERALISGMLICWT